MYERIATLIVIPLIFTYYVSKSSANYRYEAFPIKNCTENVSFYGYCVDCVTQVDCNNGVETATNVCPDNQACRTSSYYSACSDLSNVPDCSCPPNQTLEKADPYDNTKYLVCANGERHMFVCPEGEIYNPETEFCYTPTTTTPTTTTPSGCALGENTVVSVNCTCYRYCFATGGFEDFCCNAGEIYNNLTDSCEFYELFSCAGKDDGTYVDYHNCSIYYTCVNQEIFATEYCLDGLIFNESTGLCEEGECNVIEDCGVCPDADTYIKIDCLNYYDCVENSESSGPEFIPVAETCPEGTCFDPDTGTC